jgi:hypothetical protein
LTRTPTKGDMEFAVRQRVNCRCGLCGDLLAEDVSLRESARLIAAHRRDVHGLAEKTDQQAGNRAAREEADERLLDALGEWRTVKELCALIGVQEMALRQRLYRLVANERVERRDPRVGPAQFRRA